MSGPAKGSLVPCWINTDFVHLVMKKAEPQGNDVIESINVESACPEGYGFVSRMFRITVSSREDGTEKRNVRRLLLKCSVSEGMVRDEGEKANVFSVESLVLSRFMPEVHRVLSSAEGDDFRTLTAGCLHWGDQPTNFLVLEDLVAAGFTMADAGRPLDYEHCAAVLRGYARLHAASARVLKDRPDYKDDLDPDPIAAVRDYVRLLAASTFRALAQELKECPGYSKYTDRYLQISDVTVDRLLQERGNKDSELLVMLHGDCWKNNFMFKYDAGKITDIRIVDFQLSTTGRPVVDVQHFLYSSASEQVHRNQLEELLHLYHGSLQDSLRTLGLASEADFYSWRKFREDMDRAAHVGLFCSIFNVINLTSETLGSEIAEFLADAKFSEQFFAKAYANPYSLSYLKYLTPLFEKKGLL